MTDYMTIEAKRRSVCESCRGTVRKGDYIYFTPALGAWHTTCPAPAYRVNERHGKCRACRKPVSKHRGAIKPNPNGTYSIWCLDCM